MGKLALVLALLLIVGCSAQDSRLPILGEEIVDPISGELRHYETPQFQLVNQLDQAVSEQTFAGKIQIADFFFTSCPTICPIMTLHLKIVEEAFAQEDEVAITSFSIDARHDTPERLLKYAEQYAINNDKWSLLTGESDLIFELAKDYKVRAFDDSYAGAEANLIHDGTFVLVDGQRHVRGYYNGLEMTDIDRLINDVKKLLRE